MSRFVLHCHFPGPELNPEADDRLSVCETDDEVVYDDARIEGEGNAEDLKLNHPSVCRYSWTSVTLNCHIKCTQFAVLI